MDIFSIRLKEERKAKEYSQRDFAKLLEISQSTYSGYELIGEKGGRQPSFDTIRKISKLLDISVDYLLGLKAEP